MILQKLKTDAEAYLGEPVDPGRHHGAGLLQRRPAPGDQGRRPDRRPRRAAHHQRADGGRAGLRPRQEEGREDRGLRPRRRHLRRVRARDRRRRLRGQGDQRRHPPGRRRLRQGASSTGWSPNSRSRQAIDLRATRWPCSASRRRPRRPRSSSRRPRRRRSTCPSSRPTPVGPKHLDTRLTRAKLERADRRPARARRRARPRRRWRTPGDGRQARSTRSCWSAA